MWHSILLNYMILFHYEIISALCEHQHTVDHDVKTKDVDDSTLSIHQY